MSINATASEVTTTNGRPASPGAFRQSHADIRVVDGRVAVVMSESLARRLRLTVGTRVDVEDHDSFLVIGVEPSKRPTPDELLANIGPADYGPWDPEVGGYEQ